MSDRRVIRGTKNPWLTSQIQGFFGVRPSHVPGADLALQSDAYGSFPGHNRAPAYEGPKQREHDEPHDHGAMSLARPVFPITYRVRVWVSHRSSPGLHRYGMSPSSPHE